VDSPRCSLSEFCVAMIVVMEVLELGKVTSKMLQATEPLLTEEELIVDVVEPFDDTVTPGFSFGDKEHLHTQLQAGSDQQAETPRIAIRSSKRELVVQLEVVGQSQTTPGGKKCLYDGLITLGRDRFQRHGITEGIDEMQAIESCSAMQIPRADEVKLMNNIRSLGPEGRIGSSPWLVSGLGG